MINQILELVKIGANIFSDERKLYFIKRVDELQAIVYKNEDADFYDKDMNQKAIAERQLAEETEKLRLKFVSEATK
jgi:hypothetical protein